MATVTDTDNALLGIEDTANFLGETTSDTGNMDNLRDVINAVSWRFNSETHRNLKSRSYTEVYDGDGSTSLSLDNYPLSSTTITITIDNTRAFTDTGLVVTSTDIMLTTDQALIRLDGKTFSRGANNVQVQYSAGYTTSLGDAEDLRWVTKEHVKLMWNREQNRGTIGVRTEAFEGVSRTFELDIPWSVRQVLNLYRERNVG